MYDCIVVGAGIEGSATAYFLAKKKHNTLLLDQVSSWGETGEGVLTYLAERGCVAFLQEIL